MKKRAGMPSFLEALLPLLPVLPLTSRLHACLPVLVFILAATALLTVFFKITAPLFPKKLLSFSFLCGALFLTAGGVYFLEQPPAAFLSIWLLWLNESPDVPRAAVFKFRGRKWFFFALLGFYLAEFQELLGFRLGLPLFKGAAGAFLLLVLPALFWPRSRRKKGALKRKEPLPEGWSHE